MSNVLVDRELLDSAATWLEVHAPGGGCVEGSVAEDLRAILEQPAEAEGVEVVAYVGCQARMTTEGWENGEEYLVFADQASDADKRYDVPLMTVAQHLAALAAVTAERDRLLQELAKSETNTMALMVKHFAGSMSSREQDRKLDECLSEGIAMLEAERDQYRAEVEALRKDAERYRWLRDQAPKARGEWEIDGQRYGMMLGADQDDVDEAVDALMSAMAAKEA